MRAVLGGVGIGHTLPGGCWVWACGVVVQYPGGAVGWWFGGRPFGITGVILKTRRTHVQARGHP